mmetsp:Transcript_24948/g.41110  ORF Transcript_24948/g.41110 Transcript_24948/m.41110 type:complete len:155 (+) Transcript_24948:46-510(+)
MDVEETTPVNEGVCETLQVILQEKCHTCMSTKYGIACKKELAQWNEENADQQDSPDFDDCIVATICGEDEDGDGFFLDDNFDSAHHHELEYAHSQKEAMLQLEPDAQYPGIRNMPPLSSFLPSEDSNDDMANAFFESTGSELLFLGDQECLMLL